MFFHRLRKGYDSFLRKIIPSSTKLEVDSTPKASQELKVRMRTPKVSITFVSCLGNIQPITVFLVPTNLCLTP